MLQTTQINRVTKQTPCSICGKPDWCGMNADGSLAICMREPKGSIGTAKNGGYIHMRKDHVPSDWRPRTKTFKIETNVNNDSRYRWLNDLLRNGITDSRFDSLAKQIGLSVDSLHRLQVGWCNCLKVWSFPMFAPDGRITGFRLRTPTGQKFSMTGGHEGLFIPRSLCFDHRRLFIAEGPTDTAACLDLGLDAIGRPSCMGAVNMTMEFVRQSWPLDVIIFADGDTPGQRGAAVLAGALLGVARTVRIITPPAGIKDVREWRRRGATREDVLNLVKRIAPIKFEIHGETA